MKRVTREQFTLDKVKLDKKNNGLESAYTVLNLIGNERYYDGQTVKSTKIPHPDLTTKLQAVKPFLLHSLGRPTEGDDISDYQVRGVHISGATKKGVLITGVYEAMNETKVSVISPRIIIEDKVWGFEDQLLAVMKDIEEEVYEYIFNDKQAQLSIEFGE